METETHQASENLKVFFEKLLKLKSFVYEKKNSLRIDDVDYVINEIYERLDAIIKEKK